MAGSLSNYAEGKILEHSVGKSAWGTLVGAVYVGLYTATPSDTSTGSSGGTEVTGGSYARKLTAAADWNTSSGGSISNANDIVFATASASWGTVTQVGLFDAVTAGNLLWWGDLTTSKTVASGDVFKFLATQLVLTLD
jgi:uncharacterized protein YaiE (UPF0345 family)